jgi:hypothetical protein
VTVDLNDPVAVALAVTVALRAGGIEHALYGGLALASYGRPRETKDADVAVAGLSTELASDALRTAGLDAVLTFDRARFGGLSITRFTLLGGDGELNVADLVEPRSPGFSRRALGRALDGALRGQTISVVAPEDFILFKLLSTRARDIEDAKAVRKALGDALDGGLIEREATALAEELRDHDVRGRLRSYLQDD